LRNTSKPRRTSPSPWLPAHPFLSAATQAHCANGMHAVLLALPENAAAAPGCTKDSALRQTQGTTQ